MTESSLFDERRGIDDTICAAYAAPGTRVALRVCQGTLVLDIGRVHLPPKKGKAVLPTDPALRELAAELVQGVADTIQTRVTAFAQLVEEKFP